MRKKATKKPKERNKNLLLVADYTLFSYIYVRQVATGKRSNSIIERAIEAAQSNNLEALVTIRQERIAELNNQNAA